MGGGGGGHLKWPASLVFTQSFVQTQIKENIKAPRHWPLCGEFPAGTGEFPAQMASNAENVSIWWRQHVKLTAYVTQTGYKGLAIAHVGNLDVIFQIVSLDDI